MSSFCQKKGLCCPKSTLWQVTIIQIIHYHPTFRKFLNKARKAGVTLTIDQDSTQLMLDQTDFLSGTINLTAHRSKSDHHFESERWVACHREWLQRGISICAGYHVALSAFFFCSTSQSLKSLLWKYSERIWEWFAQLGQSSIIGKLALQGDHFPQVSVPRNKRFFNGTKTISHRVTPQMHG